MRQFYIFLLVSATVLAAALLTIAAALLTIAASRLTTAAGRPMITVIIIQMSWSKAQDDTLDLLRQFLPEVEAQLRAEIEPRLRQQAQAIAEDQLYKIQSQFQQEFQQALVELSLKFSQIEAEKKAAATLQISTLQCELQQHNIAKLASAHQQLMLQKFDTDILNHQKMQQIGKEIEREAAELLMEKYYANRARKEKELRVRVENRAQRERSQLDETIRKEVVAKSGLSQLREQLKILRVEVASEKSKCNVRVRAVINQTSEIMKKAKEHEQHDLDQIIHDLQSEIGYFRQRKNKTTKIDTSSQISQLQSHPFGPRQVQCHPRQAQGLRLAKQESTQQLPLQGLSKPHQYIYQDISFDSSRITESQEQHSHASDSQIPEPPEQPATQPKHLTLPAIETGPLLRFNVDQAANEWQDDEFDRFLRSEVQKENRGNNGEGERKSNFSSLYQQHLQNLNNRSKNRGKVRLSQKAKQQLLENWGQQKQKF